MPNTIKKPVTVEDIGIHSGEKVVLTLKPAVVGHGIEFVRTDLKQSVKVSPEVFDGANNQSCIVKDGQNFVKTVEHLMSAIYGLGLDALIIEVSSAEMPAMDGSAAEYVKLIKKAGLKEQKGAEMPELVLKEPLFEQGKEDTFIVALPAKELKISLVVEYKEPVGKQIFSSIINRNIYEKEIAPARTFGWREDLDKMQQKGLALGVKVNKNAIGIAENKGYSCPLRFADEVVRHKVLDIVGDLAGLRKNLKAHIIGHKTNHRLNINFMKKLAKI